MEDHRQEPANAKKWSEWYLTRHSGGIGLSHEIHYTDETSDDIGKYEACYPMNTTKCETDK